MASLFGNIRKRLLSRNKIGNYLKYTLGEVVLVVIGILIAVSINNWNEERKQKKVLNSIFTVLVEDIKNDTAEVQQIIDLYQARKKVFLTGEIITPGSLIICC